MNTMSWAGIFTIVISAMIFMLILYLRARNQREMHMFNARMLQRQLIDALSWALNAHMIRLSEFDQWVDWVKHEQRLEEFVDAYECGVDVQYKLPVEIRALYCAKIANQPFLNEVA